ncbi:HAD family hydrolase [uncultured Sphaerochaeta sp.]|uniref:HAD family hydrolase n=1 Tax=uncultured Sphaerochaeta sp. TaxID=886478 RepID=UPI002A0A8867|nr:HAD family hydrolase [uncultured Sphaerochaeta sp.]
MREKSLTIFDFDGTLYPINSYDSEQLLILSAAKERGVLFKKRGKHFIEQDLKGVFDDTSFHHRYEKLVKRATPAMIDEVAELLVSHIGEREKDALLELSHISDLGILTCGTENIAQAFLQKLGMEDSFSFIRGKRLVRNEEDIFHLLVDIAGPGDKALAVDSLREDYQTIIAIGDGPTDIPMLEAADYGMIVAWSRQNRQYPFDTFPSLESAVLHSIDYLESNTRALERARR